MGNSSSKIKIGVLVHLLSYTIGITGFLSVVSHIDIIYTIIFITLIGISFYSGYKQLNIPRWLLNIIAFVFVALTFTRLTLEDPITPIIEALLILLAIKYLETRAIKDHLQIYLISILLLAGSALLSINIEYLLYLISIMFMISLAIVSLTFYSQDKDLMLDIKVIKSLLLKSTVIPLSAIPLTAFLFFILPRTNYPLLNFLNKDTKVVGFSDTVRLGEVSNIQIDNAIVMRVKMSPIPSEKLYWRAITFDYFDGMGWRNSDSEALSRPIPLFEEGEMISYTVYLEPFDNRYLPHLDKPLRSSIKDVTFHGDLTFSLPQGITRRFRYDGESVISDVLPENVVNRQKYLQLPEMEIERIQVLTNQIISNKEIISNKNELSLAIAISDFLKHSDFKYSITSLPITNNPVNDFLFKYKYGNCEYFASAMTVMLRVIGIPARMAGGYRGGIYNDLGGYYTVLQKNAHVWVEAYITNIGWVRFDPTPSAELYSSKVGLLEKLGMIFDTINFHWNALIVNYDLHKQISLLYKLRLNVQRFRLSLDLIKDNLFYIFFLLLFSIIFFLIILYRRTSFFKKVSYEERIIREFLAIMQKKGYTKADSEGLEEFANKISTYKVRVKALEFIRAFESYFYRDKKLTKYEYERLRSLLRSFK